MKHTRNFEITLKEIEALKIALAISLKLTEKREASASTVRGSEFRDAAHELLRRLAELES